MNAAEAWIYYFKLELNYILSNFFSKNLLNLKGIDISENNQYAVFGIDTVGRRQYTLHIKDLTTNRILPIAIKNTTGDATWANDHKTLFYTQKNNLIFF